MGNEGLEKIKMGFFDFFSGSPDFAPENGVNLAGNGVLAVPADNPFAFDMFGSGVMAPGGSTTAGSMGSVNGSFTPFDQSKLSNSLFDVMSSGIQTISTSVGKAASSAVAGAMNPNSQAQNNFLKSFFTNFSSTKTGQQVQQQAIAGTITSYMQSPITWLVLAVGIVALVFVAKK